MTGFLSFIATMWKLEAPCAVELGKSLGLSRAGYSKLSWNDLERLRHAFLARWPALDPKSSRAKQIQMAILGKKAADS